MLLFTVSRYKYIYYDLNFRFYIIHHLCFNKHFINILLLIFKRLETKCIVIEFLLALCILIDISIRILSEGLIVKNLFLFF